MAEVTEAKIGLEIDSKSEQLMKEFLAHRDAYIAKHGGTSDERRLFESWAIQKIAGLHCLVLRLADQIACLEAKRKTQ